MCRILEYVHLKKLIIEMLPENLDDLLPICKEIVDTSGSVPINPGDGINYWLVAFFNNCLIINSIFLSIYYC